MHLYIGLCFFVLVCFVVVVTYEAENTICLVEVKLRLTSVQFYNNKSITVIFSCNEKSKAPFTCALQPRVSQPTEEHVGTQIEGSIYLFHCFLIQSQ